MHFICGAKMAGFRRAGAQMLQLEMQQRILSSRTDRVEQLAHYNGAIINATGIQIYQFLLAALPGDGKYRWDRALAKKGVQPCACTKSLMSGRCG